jgi:hypothetical protein
MKVSADTFQPLTPSVQNGMKVTKSKETAWIAAWLFKGLG